MQIDLLSKSNVKLIVQWQQLCIYNIMPLLNRSPIQVASSIQQSS